MNNETYDYVKSKEQESTYLFTSRGPKGEILKAVKLTEIEQSNLPSFLKNIYSLSFGNWDEESKEIDYLTRSNNSDIQKILNTVFEIAIKFLSSNSDVTLYFAGSVDEKSLFVGRNQRNTIYSRMIERKWEYLSEDYKVAGIRLRRVVDYEPNRAFEGFLVKRK